MLSDWVLLDIQHMKAVMFNIKCSYLKIVPLHGISGLAVWCKLYWKHNTVQM